MIFHSHSFNFCSCLGQGGSCFASTEQKWRRRYYITFILSAFHMPSTLIFWQFLFIRGQWEYRRERQIIWFHDDGKADRFTGWSNWSCASGNCNYAIKENSDFTLCAVLFERWAFKVNCCVCYCPYKCPPLLFCRRKHFNIHIYLHWDLIREFKTFTLGLVIIFKFVSRF
jgi:hypothetical protein